jgi:hypothetical protein
MKEQHFKYAEELDSVPLPPEDNEDSLKILQVKNLIPIEVMCEFEGKTKKIFAYIDYATQEIIIPDAVGNPNYSEVPCKEFKQKTLEFLIWRRNSCSQEPEVPEKLYEEIRNKRKQMQSPKYDLGEENARED